MQLLVHYLEAQQDGSENEEVLESANKVMRIFLDILESERKGATSKDKRWAIAIQRCSLISAHSASDMEYLRQCAAISLLKLARHKSYEALLTEDDFHQVAYSIQVWHPALKSASSRKCLVRTHALRSGKQYLMQCQRGCYP